MAKSEIAFFEEKIASFWEGLKVNEKINEESQTRKKSFVFFDGPPFANGLPHYGHILAMSIKDAIVRFRLLLGEGVILKFGWDTHGLPVEYEVEKELGFSGRRAILEFGIDRFNKACRDSVLRYRGEWEKVIKRIGRLGPLKDAYITMSSEYMENIWWVFKEVYKKGLIYQSFQALPYCPRCATPLSNFETNQGYQDNVPSDSIYVLFQLKDKKEEYLLAWTTTPWTLPGNVLLALGKDFDYSLIEILEGRFRGYKIWLAEERVTKVLKGVSYRVIKKEKGEELVKLYPQGYISLYEAKSLQDLGQIKDCLFHLVCADFVSLEEGSGIVHIAPAYGEEDLALLEEIFGKNETKKIVEATEHIDRDGRVRSSYFEGVPGWVFDFDKFYKEKLKEEGKILKEERIFHTYPFCWRCDTPLIYYAVPAWYIAVSRLRRELASENQKIHWIPAHLKEGRFGKWLTEARDWAISRQRFWGTPIPIWRCQKCGSTKVFGSKEELIKQAIGKAELSDLHRPEIDRIKVACECGGIALRIEEVLDCWFESGAMPYAYQGILSSFGGDIKEFLEKGGFPADFIAEGQDQTRGWFYTLHVLSVILTGMPAFKNVIVNGLILARDGKKLSKRLRNYPEVSEVVDQFGADALRLFLLSSPAAEAREVRFSSEAIAESAHRPLLIARNVLSFFKNYSQLHKINQLSLSFNEETLLDKWLKERTQKALEASRRAYLVYRLPRAARAILDYILDLSQWYLRRSRDRARADAPLEEASSMLENLASSLFALAHMLLPLAPFFAEEIYQTLKEYQPNNSLPESLQYSSWPKMGRADEALLADMKLVREIASKILNERKRAGIPVRQPLKRAEVSFAGFQLKANFAGYEKLILEETNILEVGWREGPNLSVKLTTSLDEKLIWLGAKREFVRLIQELRRKADCQFSESINLFVASDSPSVRKLASQVSKEYGSRLFLKAVFFESEEEPDACLEHKVFGEVISVSLKKVQN